MASRIPQQPTRAARRRPRRHRRQPIRSTTGRRTPTVLGTSVKRLDGPDKVTGRAKYTFDINRPGMLYGRIVRSPHPHARVVSVDLSAAQRAPGVKAALVWTRSRRHQEQPGDVPGGRGRGGRRRHRGARHRRGAADQGRVRSAAARHRRRAGAGRARRRRCSPAATCAQGQTQEAGDLAAGFKAAAHTHRRNLLDARHHARLHGVARHRLRVGRRQADGLGLDAGHQQRARELRQRRWPFRSPTSASSASTWAAASAASWRSAPKG